jgi:hypothetical protein
MMIWFIIYGIQATSSEHLSWHEIYDFPSGKVMFIM